jgi:hypothetical protein
LIRPEKEEIDYYDFKKMDLMIEEWYRVAKNLII